MRILGQAGIYSKIGDRKKKKAVMKEEKTIIIPPFAIW